MERERDVEKKRNSIVICVPFFRVARKITIQNGKTIYQTIV